MARRKISNISIDGATIGFRNFSGKEGKFNTEGNRNFSVFLTSELAHELLQDGWNVRWLTPKNEDEEPQGILQVKVGYGNYPPKIVLVGKGNALTAVSEETVHILDWAEIAHVDLIIRPYEYDVNGKQGIKAYLKTMYVVIAPDIFADRYTATPDSAQACIMQEDGSCI